jgi:rhodanese-related sulfurtransferase
MISRSNIGFIPASVSFILTACSVPETNVVQPEMKKAESRTTVSEKPRAEVSTISLEDFFQLYESGKVLVIDARPSFVYQFGHIPRAINLPKSGCDEAIAKRDAEFRTALAEGKKIIVYCTGPNCSDARTVAVHLGSRGISASVFASGWEAWHEAGMPIE